MTDDRKRRREDGGDDEDERPAAAGSQPRQPDDTGLSLLAAADGSGQGGARDGPASRQGGDSHGTASVRQDTVAGARAQTAPGVGAATPQGAGTSIPSAGGLAAGAAPHAPDSAGPAVIMQQASEPFGTCSSPTLHVAGSPPATAPPPAPGGAPQWRHHGTVRLPPAGAAAERGAPGMAATWLARGRPTAWQPWQPHSVGGGAPPPQPFLRPASPDAAAVPAAQQQQQQQQAQQGQQLQPEGGQPADATAPAAAPGASPAGVAAPLAAAASSPASLARGMPPPAAPPQPTLAAALLTALQQRTGAPAAAGGDACPATLAQPLQPHPAPATQLAQLQLATVTAQLQRIRQELSCQHGALLAAALPGPAAPPPAAAQPAQPAEGDVARLLAALSSPRAVPQSPFQARLGFGPGWQSFGALAGSPCAALAPPHLPPAMLRASASAPLLATLPQQQHADAMQSQAADASELAATLVTLQSLGREGSSPSFALHQQPTVTSAPLPPLAAQLSPALHGPPPALRPTLALPPGQPLPSPALGPPAALHPSLGLPPLRPALAPAPGQQPLPLSVVAALPLAQLQLLPLAMLPVGELAALPLEQLVALPRGLRDYLLAALNAQRSAAEAQLRQLAGALPQQAQQQQPAEALLAALAALAGAPAGGRVPPAGPGPGGAPP